MVAIARPVVIGDVLPKVKARTAILVVGFALLTALAAQIKIGLDFTPVPITGQTLAVLLAGAVLGSRLGAISQVLYVGLGLFLPFYAGGESGWSYLTGSTGGYLVGMVAAAFLVGKLAERSADRTFLTSIPAMVFGSVVVYAIGTPWLSVVGDMSIQNAVVDGITPFLIGDGVKALLAGLALPIIWHYTNKSDSSGEASKS